MSPTRSPRTGRYLHHCGFTLLELSIVLVIIGLIVGGIVAGRNLIRSAELNSIVSDIDTFRSAANTFRDKYGQIPGDFTRSSAYWPTDCAPTPTQCDGDGDSIIDNDSENLRIWSHLSSAQLLEGRYTYLTSTQFAPSLIVPAEQRYRPVTDIEGGAYWAYSQVQGGMRRNMLGIGGAVELSHNIDPFLTGVEVFSLDTKMDDGNPEAGNLRSVEPGLFVGSLEESGSCSPELDDPGCAVFILDMF